jgi:hypothetical protein
MKQPKIVLHSALAPDAVIETLLRSADKEQRSLFFSISGYKGDHPVLCKFEEGIFRLRIRRYDRNFFAPCLFAEFYPETRGTGTRFEVHFDSELLAKVPMYILIGFAVLCGGPVFVVTLFDLITGSHHGLDGGWIGVVVPPAMILYGILLPMWGRFASRGEERFLIEFLQNNLAARIEDSANEIQLQSSR